MTNVSNETDKETNNKTKSKNNQQESLEHLENRRLSRSDLSVIREQLDILNQHKFIRLYNSAPKMLFFQFLRGIAFGLGSVLGATIVVSLVISALSHVEFIPILGEWATEIIAEIQPSDAR